MDAPIAVADSHVHFWDRRRWPYPWLDGLEELRKPHLPEDLHREVRPFDIREIVFVQAEIAREHALDEAKWAAELAEADPRVQAFVAFAPLHRGAAAAEDLDALAAIPMVRGIRQIIGFEPGLDFCLRPDFLEGLRLLPARRFSFDINITAAHLPNVVEMVDATPEVAYVLDHMAGPPIEAGGWEPWASGLRELARRERVHCKISGAATAADRESWTTDDLRRYIDHVIEYFGVDRVMFGSDWPVCKLAAEYSQWADAFAELIAAYSPGERDAMWRANARRFYRLEG